MKSIKISANARSISSRLASSVMWPDGAQGSNEAALMGFDMEDGQACAPSGGRPARAEGTGRKRWTLSLEGLVAGLLPRQLAFLASRHVGDLITSTSFCATVHAKTTCAGVIDLLDQLGSFGFDVGRPDYLSPLLSIVDQEFPEVGWRQRHRNVPEAGDAFPNFGI